MFANFNIHNSSREPIGRATNIDIGLASVTPRSTEVHVNLVSH